MKKILFVLLFAVIVLPAFSDATWKEFLSKDKTLYLDAASVANSGEQYLYWIKSNNQDGYKKILMRSDCSNNTTGVQKIIVYDSNDKVIKSEDINQELSYVVPDSDAQAAYNFVCNKHKEVKANAEKKAKQKSLLNPYNIINAVNGVNNVGNSIMDTTRILKQW